MRINSAGVRNRRGRWVGGEGTRGRCGEERYRIPVAEEEKRTASSKNGGVSDVVVDQNVVERMMNIG